MFMQLSYSSEQSKEHDHDHSDEICELNYRNCRCDMRNADVLLFRGTGLSSWIIQKRTHSPYSHAGIVTWWNRRLIVLEAVTSGVRVVPLSYLLRQYPGGVDFFRTTHQIDEPTRLKMVIFAQEQLGKPYNKRLMIRYALKNALGLPFSNKDKVRDRPANQYFCSQYVAEIYNRAGFDLHIGLSDKYTSPKEIAESSFMQYVGTLKE